MSRQFLSPRCVPFCVRRRRAGATPFADAAAAASSRFAFVRSALSACLSPRLASHQSGGAKEHSNAHHRCHPAGRRQNSHRKPATKGAYLRDWRFICGFGARVRWCGWETTCGCAAGTGFRRCQLCRGGKSCHHRNSCTPSAAPGHVCYLWKGLCEFGGWGSAGSCVWFVPASVGGWPSQRTPLRAQLRQHQTQSHRCSR